MRRIVTSLIFSTIAIMFFTNCQNKKINEESSHNAQQLDSTNQQLSNQVENIKNIKSDDVLSFNSYIFAENLKNDNFFESENTGKLIELKDVGIISYLISGDEVTLTGIFYNKEKNLGIPIFTNNPPGLAFIPKYFDKLEIQYEDKYKHNYSASLYITLKEPKAVKKLKMYLASEAYRIYEYKVDKGGIETEYRNGFVDLLRVTGVFKGKSNVVNYTETVYEIDDAEIN